MGLEETCRVTLNGRECEGIAHCGDGEISFKGEFRLRWKWRELDSSSSSGGVLELTKGSETAHFHVGALADKWLHAIRNPKSRLDKLGLRTGHAYAMWGAFDDAFPCECLDRAGDPSEGTGLDILFVRLDSVLDLQTISRARERIKPNGMIWAVWPKGRKELKEGHVRDYALANGLVDVKVASFSETLSALKLVIPVALR